MAITGLIAAGLLIGVAGFQVALAAGAGWGHLAFGGRAVEAPGPLPPRMRRVSGANAAALVLMAVLTLDGSGWLSLGVPPAAQRVVLWALCGFMALNTVGNLAARHPFERFGMGAVSLTLALLLGRLALGLG
ncbi:MAG: hypothetical protein H6702_24175 [Myxococcales bacterium]|nr:hypothetical protein [Myxococcales bacterium]